MKVIKRNGSERDFDESKINEAIKKANNEVSELDQLSLEEINNIVKETTKECENLNRAINIEEIQDLVENKLIDSKKYELARRYITYRYKRNLARKTSDLDEKIFAIMNNDSEEAKQENANKNPSTVPTMRDYAAGEVSKDISKRMLVPEDVWKAHELGIIHFHDADYFMQPMNNCGLVNLLDMLINGTVISSTQIDPPKTFSTACNIGTQIIAQVASSQYGGQSISLAHLAPFVDKTRKKFYKKFKEYFENLGISCSEEKLNKLVEDEVLKDIEKGVQIIQYQVQTLMTTNGQAPFITVFMYLGEVQDPTTKNDLALIIEEVLKQRILGVKNDKGVYVTPAFPKLIYVLEEDNIQKNSKYFYLSELAAKCTASRLVPDYISEKKMKELKEGNCFPIMGCRSILSPWKDENGKYKFYGRFNQGVVTINLIDVALSSKGDEKEFWRIFDERLQLCYKGLMCRHNRLKGVKSDVAPILWQNGAYARLKPGETIDKLLYGGYSSISLGYAGLYECVKYMTGKSHTDPESTPFSDEVMKHMFDKCNEWKKQTNIGFSLYGTPIESTTYKFAKCLQKRFGTIPGITDKNFITNSCHVFVEEEIDAFSKIKFEAHYQKWSNGGMISYIETPNLKNNIPAVLQVMKYIYDNSIYAELNTKSCYCKTCGFDGMIPIVKENGKYKFKCPCCGESKNENLYVALRVCGYIGLNDMNQGRMEEVSNRALHL